jgi:predicted Mrr-cat superfamily restriction endonuclease
MIDAKMLVDSQICISFAEARRLIQCASEEKLMRLLKQKEGQKWGRKLKKCVRLVWPEL